MAADLAPRVTRSSSSCANVRNLALFYKHFDYSRGLIKIARITSGMTAFTVSGSLTAKIELLEQ